MGVFIIDVLRYIEALKGFYLHLGAGWCLYMWVGGR